MTLVLRVALPAVVVSPVVVANHVIMETGEDQKTYVPMFKPIFFATLVIAGAFIFFNYLHVKNKERQAEFFREKTAQADADWRNARIGSSVNALEEAVQGSPDKEKEASAKFDLGLAYAFSGRLADAAVLFKEIVTNDSYSDLYRAGAMNRLLAVYGLTKDRNFADRVIFSGSVFWEDFKKDADTNAAVRRAYEWVLERQGGATPNYEVARWYAERLWEDNLRNESRLAAGERIDYENAVKINLKEGDNSISQVLASVRIKPWEKAMIVNLRGVAYAMAYVAGVDEEAKNDAERAFVQAEELLKGITDQGYAAQYEEISTRFINYDRARFVAYRMSVRKEKLASELKTILDPIIGANGQNLDFFVLLKNVGKFPDTDATKKLTLMIAENDSRFKELLRDIGWAL